MSDITKEFLGQKLPYMTNPQKKYLEKIQIPLDGYRNRVQEELKNLERPKASWTLTDLIASGAQFPSTFMGKTTYIDPDNTFLVGYKAFQNLRSAYRFMAEHAQNALNDTVFCKECLYLTAYCEMSVRLAAGGQKPGYKGRGIVGTDVDIPERCHSGCARGLYSRTWKPVDDAGEKLGQDYHRPGEGYGFPRHWKV